MNRRLIFAVVLVACVSAPGCRLFRGRKHTARPAVLQLPVPAPKTEPKPVPAPPEIEPGVDVTQMPEPPQEPWPGPPPRPRRRPRPTPTPSTPEAAPPEQAQTPAPEMPQLGQVLTPEQQQAYNQVIDRNLDRAQRTVAALSNRRLSHEQSSYLDRIRTFIRQANETRKVDLPQAATLAERAGLLADDLLRSIQ